MEEIELKECFHILFKRIWIIILIIILTVSSSGLISYLVLEPEYETFTTLMVGKPKSFNNEKMQYQDVLMNQKLVSTYGEIAKSRIVSREVIDNLDLNLSSNEFKEKINISLVNDTEIIKIKVTDTNPLLATKIANETAEVFMKNILDIMEIENIQIIDKAEVPNNPISPRPILNMLIAGVLGMMISVFIIFLLEYMDNTIKTPENVEKHLDLAVIGMIPKMEDKK